MVDLRHRTCRERAPGDRLLERILTPAEREWLEEATGPAPGAQGPPGSSMGPAPPALPPAHGSPGAWMVALWALWAAKETAFKVVSKLSAPPEVFRHRGFHCSLELTAAECPGVVRIRGAVRGPEVPGEVAVEGSSDGEHVHLVGWARTGAPSGGGSGRIRNGGGGPAAPPLEVGLEWSSDRLGDLAGYRPHFSDLEWEGIHTVHAAEARLRARTRLEAYLGEGGGSVGDGSVGGGGAGAGAGAADPRGASAPPAPPAVTPSAVEIVTSGARPGRTPPRIRVGGRERPDLELSLSHHGRFVAWALLVPETGTEKGAP